MVFNGRQRLVFAALTVAFALFAGAVAVETALRVTAYYPCALAETFPPLYLPSAQRNHQHRPNATVSHCSYYGDYRVVYHTDANGDRVTPHAPETSQSIVAIGDSYTFGIGVNDEETFAARLQARVPARVVNRGVAGYTIDQEVQLLRETLERGDRPCAIVLQATPGNDFEDLGRHDANGHDAVYHVDDTGRLNENAAHVSFMKILARQWFLYRLIMEGRGRVTESTTAIAYDPVWDIRNGDRKEYLALYTAWMQSHDEVLTRYFLNADAFFRISGEIPVTVLMG